MDDEKIGLFFPFFFLPHMDNKRSMQVSRERIIILFDDDDDASVWSYSTERTASSQPLSSILIEFAKIIGREALLLITDSLLYGSGHKRRPSGETSRSLFYDRQPIRETGAAAARFQIIIFHFHIYCQSSHHRW